MDEPAGDGDRVELEVGEDLGDLDAVRDERVAGQALLSLVRLLAEPVGAHEQVPVEPLRELLVAIQPGMLVFSLTAPAVTTVLPPRSSCSVPFR